MSRSDYYKQWWAQNRDRILAARKARYEQDPEYKKKVQERARKRYARLTKGKGKRVFRFNTRAIEKLAKSLGIG